MNLKRLVFLVVAGYFLTIVAVLAGSWKYWEAGPYWVWSDSLTWGKKQPVQPVNYSHVIHAGKLGLDCTFCHENVTKGPKATPPPVEKCMSCHKSVRTERPEIKKLTGYWERKEPVPWIKVHNLPDHVRFPHDRHVKFFSEKDGVPPKDTCIRCHGDVKEMPRVRQVKSLKMGFCLECHREHKAPQDCTICHK